MKRIFASLLILACLSSVTFGAIPAGAVWEVRTTGAQASGGGFCWTSLVNATYKWTASASGTNEYYCEIAAGGDPSLVGSGSVTCDGNYNLSTAGAVGSLAAGQHAFGDNDKLGYTTPYVRLANGLDPDAMIARGQPGYVSYGAGGVDYSQQANAQMSATDICIVRGDTTQVYRSGATKWAQDYDNNVIHIAAGTGHTVGWYRIVSVDANDDAVLDRSAGTAGSSSGTGAVGGAFLIGGNLDNDLLSNITAGNAVYVGSGTYTTGEPFTLKAGTATTAITKMFGYQTTRGTFPLGDNRPLFTSVFAYYMQLGGNNWVSSVRVATVGGGATVYSIGSNSLLFNVSSTNTSVSTDQHAFNFTNNYNTLIGCEGSTTGTGTSSTVFCLNYNSKAIGCYAHDSLFGYIFWNCDFQGCVADTCTTGFYAVAGPNWSTNCIAYNCTTGFSFGTITNNFWVITNCIGDNNTTDLYVNSANVNEAFYTLYNTFDGTTSFSKALNYVGNIFGDAGLNAPATGDFSIDSSDTNVYERGVDVGTFTTAITYEE
jgi:hypothetical protein